jgi:hypothetical protein
MELSDISRNFSALKISRNLSRFKNRAKRNQSEIRSVKIIKNAVSAVWNHIEIQLFGIIRYAPSG